MSIDKEKDFIIASFSGNALTDLERMRELTNRDNIGEVVKDALAVCKALNEHVKQGYRIEIKPKWCGKTKELKLY